MRLKTKIKFVFFFLVTFTYVLLAILFPIKIRDYTIEGVYSNLKTMTYNSYNDNSNLEEGYHYLYIDENLNIIHKHSDEMEISAVLDTYLFELFYGWASSQKTVLKNYQTRYDNQEIYYVIRKVDNEYYIAYTYNLKINSILNDRTTELLIIMTSLYIIIIISGTMFINHITKSINTLSKHVNQITSNDWDQEVKIDRNDEIGHLAKNIEKMRIELLKREVQKKEMFQNISHDLKTPILVIKGYVEAIKDGIFDNNVNEPLDVITNEINRLEKKVLNLLYLSKLNNINIYSNVNKEDVKIKELIEEIIPHYKLRKPNLEFVLDLNEETFTGTYDMWKIAIENILDNFLRYAKTEVKVSLTENKLVLSNDGENISDDFLDKIFQAYEIDNKGKFGLGLSITYNTINLFEYMIKAKNNENGVEFIIYK